MTLIRKGSRDYATPVPSAHVNQYAPIGDGDAPPERNQAPSLEQTVRAWHIAGHSQRAIVRELELDRRKVRRIIDEAA
jgi:hypothetical protein